MKIRISHFGSSVCLLILALLFLVSPPFAMGFLRSDPSKQNVEDVTILVYIFCYVVGAILLYNTILEAKYYILDSKGISICFLGIAYRQVKWENIFDVTIGPDPLQKYAIQTLLLNCQPGKKYRPRIGTSSSLRELESSMYENAFYKDLCRGKIICLRCGKKLDSVLMLLNECLSEDVVRQSMDIFPENATSLL